MDMPSQQSPAPITRPKRPPVGGVILLVVGVVWLLQNLGFAWAKGIWLPLLLIVFGAYLVAKKH